MNVVGTLTTAVVGVLVLGAAFVGVRSIPDIKRYLRMRRM